MSRMFANFRLPHLWRARGIYAALLCLAISIFALVSPLGVTNVSAATSAQVTVDASHTLGTLTNTSKGLNTAVWDGNLLDGAATTAIKNAGVHILRYPGGSTSDTYHWQSNTTSPGTNLLPPRITLMLLWVWHKQPAHNQ